MIREALNDAIAAYNQVRYKIMGPKIDPAYLAFEIIGEERIPGDPHMSYRLGVVDSQKVSDGYVDPQRPPHEVFCLTKEYVAES